MSIFAAVILGAALAPAQVSIPLGVDSTNITRQEAVHRADRLFELLDINHDGTLTEGEAREEGTKLMAQRFATGKDIAPGIGGHTLMYFRRALASNSSATRQIFEQTMLAHFDAMDTNHDGVLTPNERQAGRREMEASR